MGQGPASASSRISELIGVVLCGRATLRQSLSTARCTRDGSGEELTLEAALWRDRPTMPRGGGAKCDLDCLRNTIGTPTPWFPLRASPNIGANEASRNSKMAIGSITVCEGRLGWTSSDFDAFRRWPLPGR